MKYVVKQLICFILFISILSDDFVVVIYCSENMIC